MIRICFRKEGGWVYLTARDEAEARRLIARLLSLGYEVKK